MDDKKFQHIIQRLNNLEEHIINIIHPIQGLCGILQDKQRLTDLFDILSKPIKIDDTGLSRSLKEFKSISEKLKDTAENLDVVQTFAEIKYIGMRLQGLESDMRRIRIDGIRKNVSVEVTLDGHSLEKSLEKKISKKTLKRKRGRPSLRK